jgi:hypothetical protein
VQDKQHRLLRAKALECISLVGMAVGKERFRGDAQHVMGLMQQLQAQVRVRVEGHAAGGRGWRGCTL